MPGPRNQKKKKGAQNKKADKKPPPPPSVSHSPSPTPAPATPPPLAAHPYPQHVSEQPPHGTPPPVEQGLYEKPLPAYPQDASHPREGEHPISSTLLKTPLIYDPGDGPRVKDPRAFLASRFAAPPSLDDAMCAEFAEEAVLQMLCTVLPEETALILWYNKSRRTARICPACQRLYRLGDVLPDHLAGEDREQRNATRASPYLAREQEYSGLCSPVCFILAAYNYPGAIRSTWGRMAEELDDATWDLLGAPSRANDLGLGMLLKMTRCHDLGLAQLFFPDLADREPGAEGFGDEERDGGVDGGVGVGMGMHVHEDEGAESGGEGSEETVREVPAGAAYMETGHAGGGKEAREPDEESEIVAVSPTTEAELVHAQAGGALNEPDAESEIVAVSPTTEAEMLQRMARLELELGAQAEEEKEEEAAGS